MDEKRDVFISHHAESAGELAAKIGSILESNGISCWYAPRDCEKGDSGNFIVSITKAIKGCRIFLLLFNQGSNESTYVLSETKTAYDRLAKKEKIELLPLRLDESEMDDKLGFMLGMYHAVDGRPPDEDHINNLVDRIMNLLSEMPQEESNPNNRTKYKIVSARPSPDALFVGRNEEIEETVGYLTGDTNKAILVGMGGIGKSELAKVIMRKCSGRFNTFMWVSFSTSLLETVTNDYKFPISGLSREDYPADSDEDYFFRKMKIFRELADEKVLIVVDNFDVDFDPYLDEFCRGEYAILFTSRNSEISDILPEITVDRMTSEEDLIELFSKAYRPIRDDEKESILEIIRELDGHTQSVRLVASLMKKQRISAPSMLALLCKGENTSVRDADAVEKLRGKLSQIYEISGLTEEELCVLKNLALIPLSGADVRDFCDWCGFDSFDTVDDLIRRSWIKYDPAADRIHLHPLIGDMMKRELEKDCSCVDNLIEAMQGMMKTSYDDPFVKRQEKLGYISTACESLPKKSDYLIDMQMSRGLLYNQLCLFRESINAYNQIDIDSLDIGRQMMLYSRLSHSQSIWGATENNRDIIEECISHTLSYRDKYLSIPESERTVENRLVGNWLLQRLCECNRWIGDFVSAVKYGKEALDEITELSLCSEEIKKRVLRDIGWTKYHYGYSLILLGDLEKGQNQLQESLELFTEDNSPNSYAFSIYGLGQVALFKGEYQDARYQFDKASELLLDRIDDSSLEKGRNKLFIGNVFRVVGDEDKACELFRLAADHLRRYRPKLAEKVEGIIENKDVILPEIFGTPIKYRDIMNI